MKSLFFTLTLACLLSACTYHKPSHYDYFSKKQLNVDTTQLEKASEENQRLLTSTDDAQQAYHSATGHLCKKALISNEIRTACYIDQSWYFFPQVTQ